MEKSPHDLALDIYKMTDDYGKLGQRLNELKKIYAMWWETKRPDFTSDKQAEKAWDLTKEGLEIMEVSLKMKVKERKISAIKTFLRVLETEAKNQY